MMNLQTPFGNVSVLLDGKECPYLLRKLDSDPVLFPDVAGRYLVIIDFVPDGRERIVSCIIPGMEYIESGPESGERLECQSFYNIDGWKLSIGVECESGYFHRYQNKQVYVWNFMDRWR